jgi:hypothetical protein
MNDQKKRRRSTRYETPIELQVVPAAPCEGLLIFIELRLHSHVRMQLSSSSGRPIFYQPDWRCAPETASKTRLGAHVGEGTEQALMATASQNATLYFLNREKARIVVVVSRVLDRQCRFQVASCSARFQRCILIWISDLRPFWECNHDRRRRNNIRFVSDHDVV